MNDKINLQSSLASQEAQVSPAKQSQKTPAIRKLQKQVTLQISHSLELHEQLLHHIDPVQPMDNYLAKFSPIETLRQNNPKGTIFAFGGLSQSFAMPVREFFGVLSKQSYDVIFIKDFRQLWYQKGLLGITTTRAETASFLSSRFCEFPQPWISVGSSSGGFAAVYFGQKIGADRAVAFGLQSKIAPHIYNHFRSATFPDQGFDFDDPENDLRNILDGNSTTETTYDLYFGCRNVTDRNQAKRLQHFSNVTLNPVETSEHGVARILRDSGKLVDALLGK